MEALRKILDGLAKAEPHREPFVVAEMLCHLEWMVRAHIVDGFDVSYRPRRGVALDLRMVEGVGPLRFMHIEGTCPP
jgi:hypothetical protein